MSERGSEDDANSVNRAGIVAMSNEAGKDQRSGSATGSTTENDCSADQVDPVDEAPSPRERALMALLGWVSFGGRCDC